MWITLIETHDEPDHAKHTWKCHHCDDEVIKIVKI